MSRSSSSWLRTAAAFATATVLALAACGSPRGAPPASVRVDVLASGFLVDNTVLATIEELRAFLADMNARDVTLYATKDIPTDRVERTATAVRGSGATVAIVMLPAAAPPPAPAR